MIFSFVLFLLTLITNLPFSDAHGRLIQPASRSSAWRFVYGTPVNNNDNELFCGGFTTQYNSVNKGRCGICGDNFSGPKPNELPDGIYAKNLKITAKWNEASVVNIKVDITANHRGYFQFKICRAQSNLIDVTQECLDKNTLKIVTPNPSKDEYKYVLPTYLSQIYSIDVQLPRNLTCERCVVQWTYTAGNNWGPCGDGTSALGCGPQETFRGCGDVTITPSADYPLPAIVIGKPSIENGTASQPTTVKPTSQSTTTESSKTNEKTKPEQSTTEPHDTNELFNEKTRICFATGPYKAIPGMTAWCEDNCRAGYCPASHCTCR